MAHRNLPGRRIGSRLASLTKPITENTMTDSQKRKAAIDAIDEAGEYAINHAEIIANDAAALLKASGHSAWIYPELSRYIELRNTADKLMREVLP